MKDRSGSTELEEAVISLLLKSSQCLNILDCSSRYFFCWIIDSLLSETSLIWMETSLACKDQPPGAAASQTGRRAGGHGCWLVD